MKTACSAAAAAYCLQERKKNENSQNEQTLMLVFTRKHFLHALCALLQNVFDDIKISKRG